MKQRRNTLAGVAPLTPTIPPPTTLSPSTIKLMNIANDNLGRAERAESDVRLLKGMLAAERRRHVRLEAAFSKYLGILESVLQDQRLAFQQLGKPLIPYGGK